MEDAPDVCGVSNLSLPMWVELKSGLISHQADEGSMEAETTVKPDTFWYPAPCSFQAAVVRKRRLQGGANGTVVLSLISLHSIFIPIGCQLERITFHWNGLGILKDRIDPSKIDSQTFTN